MTSRRKALFTSTMIGALAVAAAAFAQTTPTSPDSTPNPAPGQSAPEAKAAQAQAQKAPETGTAAASDELIVTGSRIKRTTFTTPEPITVITPEQSQLTGTVDITEQLQQSAVAANSQQINNFFTGYLTGGGPGANTLSLRGLGAQRTLFLINGQRLGPAGVGGTVGPVDLNTLSFPISQIADIEILKDGASSIYGSDAVAGVVNIITKTKADGGDLHVFVNPSQHGGGNVYQVDGSFAKTFDRGYFNVGFSVYRQDALTVGQRPFLSCLHDEAVDLSTRTSADLIDPATGKTKCLNTFTNAIDDFASPLASADNSTLTYRPNPSSVFGGGVTGQDINGYQAVGLYVPGNPSATRASDALVPQDSPLYAKSTAISPDTRYTFTGFAGFDLTPHAELYGSLLLNQRDSNQFQLAQFFSVVNPGNVFNPGFGYPLPIVPLVYDTSQRVDYGRIVIGVKGDVPNVTFLKNWTYDVYGQFARSDGHYTSPFVYNDRVNATAGSSNAAGCDPNANINGGETMAQLEPNVACVPVNYFAAVNNGGFTAAEKAFLIGRETGDTTYNHYYVEGSATGNLFNLPAGPLGMALGFQLRREEIDDQPPPDFQDNNAYNLSTTGRTHGSDTIEEVFGEAHIPVIKNLPFVESLNVDVSGRYSDYKSYGGNETYKIGVDWQVNDWLTFRATQGTAFRAPALFELYLADQSGFLGQLSIDPCINYANSGVSQTVQKNCASQGIAPNYNGGNSSSAEILTGGGIGNLKPETSFTQTAGLVLTPKWFGLDLNIAVDYFAYDIRNQIQQFGAANIISACYNAANFPNSPFCSLFTRDLTPGSPTFQGITLVHDNYVNVARQIDQGLDLTIRYRANLPRDTKLTIDSDFQWQFYTNTILLGGQTNNYLGQVGQPTFDGNVNFRFDNGPWTVNYYINMIGHSSDLRFVSSIDPNYLRTGEAVYLNHVAPFYSISSLSVRRKFRDFSVEVGIRNLFDKNPPDYSAEGFQPRVGDIAQLVSQYDLVGRSFFIDLEKKF
ncbi:MAG TPA: TonB-dependent receptor [Caulobacteraceae bacterium]